jgi:adenosylcobinamide-GDP ribazoletransferase
VQTLLAAIKFLTLWGRFTVSGSAPEAVKRSGAYFPLVGLIIGLLLAVLNYILAPHLEPEILNIVIITVWISTTGALHLKGLKDTFDALDTRDGASGIAALLMVVLLKSAALNSMDEILALSLLLSPVVGRWALLLFFFGYHTRFDETSRDIARRVNIWPVLVSTAGTLALALYFLGRKGLWIALIVSLFTLLLRGLLHRRHVVLSLSNGGAIVELTEALSLILLASL